MLKNFFKLVVYFLGFVAVGAVAAVLIFKIINYERNVKVPLLVGKSVSEATERLNKIGLSIEIEGEDYHAEIPSEHIISQNIKQNTRVKKGTSIGVFISKGQAMFSIPYFEGMDINDVKLTLEKLGIEIEKITRVHSDTVEKGRVITQRPLPGYSSNSRVNLVVSLGSYDVFYRCPSFVDMTIDEARKVARALGLKLIEQKDGRVIIFQKPEARATVKKGDSVEVTLGRGWGVWF